MNKPQAFIFNLILFSILIYPNVFHGQNDSESQLFDNKPEKLENPDIENDAADEAAAQKEYDKRVELREERREIKIRERERIQKIKEAKKIAAGKQRELSLFGSPFGFTQYSHYEAGLKLRWLKRPSFITLEYLTLPGHERSLSTSYFQTTPTSGSWGKIEKNYGDTFENPSGLAFGMHYIFGDWTKARTFSLGFLIGGDTVSVPRHLNYFSYSGRTDSFNDPINVAYLLTALELGYQVNLPYDFFINCGVRGIFQVKTYSSDVNLYLGTASGLDSTYYLFTGTARLGYSYSFY